MRSFNLLAVASLFFVMTFAAAQFSGLEASQGRFGAYSNARPAWGGNGGWWGNTGYDPYGNNESYYDGQYPYGQHYYAPGVGVDAGVEGSGFYFNIR